MRPKVRTRLKVKKFGMVEYGTWVKAWVTLNPGQIWEVYRIPSERHAIYGIRRKGVVLEIEEEHIARFFKEV